MSVAEGRLRQVPRPRGRILERLAAHVLARVLPNIAGGRLLVETDEGGTVAFGSGAEVRMRLHSSRLLARLATRGSVGLGESFVAGEWDAPDLAEVIGLLLGNAEAARQRHPRLHRLMTARPRRARHNGLRRARRNIAYHYDLGNELFSRMLDASMTYSCAVFDEPGEPLERAQERKLRMVCDKLALNETDHVLEIGCGWGSFALLAASRYGARVTALTISAEQARFARRRVEEAGLGDLVEILECDYRLLEGQFTKVASIEMLEAIGEDQWPDYFAAIERLLLPGGRACIQTIVVPDERFARYRATPDWIERYIFPGCLIPSLAALAAARGASSALVLRSVDEIGPHYADTLREWQRRFRVGRDELRTLGYDARFERVWEFYLGSCEACFRTGWLGDAQLVFEREGSERS